MPTYYLLILVVALLSGCGTVNSLQERYPRNKIYSGVTASWSGHATFLDIPFSFVADTICLPYTIPRTIANYSQPDGTWKPFTLVTPDQLTALHLNQPKKSIQEQLGQPDYYSYYCLGRMDIHFPALRYKLLDGSRASMVFDEKNRLVAVFTLAADKERVYALGKNPCP